MAEASFVMQCGAEASGRWRRCPRRQCYGRLRQPEPRASNGPSPPGMETSTTSHKPVKGILKNKSSAASSEAASTQQSGGAIQQVPKKKSQRWDESSIPATYHRTHRDYDFMEMNKFSSPQLNSQDDGEDTVTDFDAQEAVTSDILAEELAAPRSLETKCLPRELASEGLHCSEVFLDREERQRQFTLKRKRHCDEGLAMKLARLDLEESESEGMQEENEESLCAANEKTSTEESQ